MVVYFILTSSYVLTPPLFLSVLFSVILTYSFARFLLQKLVNLRLRSLYEYIRTTPKDENQTDSKSLEDVNEDVKLWAADTRKEISDLKTLEKYRRDFVGNVSHELKTPIFSIQGYLHTILEGAMYDEKVLKKYLQRALVNVDRLQNIVEDLEVINKIEEEKVELMEERFNLHQLVSEVIDDINVQSEDDELKVSLVNMIKANQEAYGDPEAINQVLTNLIVNSIKYGKEGGETKISANNIGDKIMVEVSDNGIGIAPEHLKHLFDRFYRVESSRARKLGGSGLGLAIVKHLVDMHGGNVHVKSELDVGSTFGFTIKKA